MSTLQLFARTPIDETRAPFALFSACRSYRYVLGRALSGDPYRLLSVCMINPSRAAASENDPTIVRWIGYGERWGFGGLLVANLAAAVATNVRDLRTLVDPIGPLNDVAVLAVIHGGAWLEALALQLGQTVPAWATVAVRLFVCGWGPPSKAGMPLAETIRRRAAGVLVAARAAGVIPHALALSKDGYPVHPLMQRADLLPVPIPEVGA